MAAGLFYGYSRYSRNSSTTRSSWLAGRRRKSAGLARVSSKGVAGRVRHLGKVLGIIPGARSVRAASVTSMRAGGAVIAGDDVLCQLLQRQGAGAIANSAWRASSHSCSACSRLASSPIREGRYSCGVFVRARFPSWSVAMVTPGCRPGSGRPGQWHRQSESGSPAVQGCRSGPRSSPAAGWQ